MASIHDIQWVTTAIRQAGFPVQCTAEPGYHKTIRLHCRNNPDGSIRWVWPAGSRQASCLRFYNAGSCKAFLMTVVFRLLFFAGLERWLAAGSIILYTNERGWLSLRRQWGNDYALFTGTPGPNRKVVAWYSFQGRGFFLKIGLSDQSGALVNYETDRLSSLRGLSLNKWLLPEPLGLSPGVSRISDIRTSGAKRRSRFGEDHAAALQELYEKTSSVVKIGDLPNWKQTESDLEELLQGEDHRLPRGLIRKLKYLFNQVDPGQDIVVSEAHKDFTPWNMFIAGQRLAVYDWELSAGTTPVLWDVCHFVFQSGILQHRQDARPVMSEWLTILRQSYWKLSCCRSVVQRQLTLELYLLQNTVYYLQLYRKQSQWHLQVHWLLETWSQALSMLLAGKKVLTARQLICMDLFDRLDRYTYAALKWESRKPEELPLLSDIDLCLKKQDLSAVLSWLHCHPLVAQTAVKYSSFMCKATVHGRDGLRLSLDLIWQFKRRQWIMLNAGGVLEHVRIDQWGVKQPACNMDFNYTWLFYCLNGASIPARHRYRLAPAEPAAITALDTVFREEWQHITGLRYRCEAFDYNAQVARKLVHFIRSQKENSGYRRGLNTIRYATDTIRDYFRDRGMIITFSGVDGAGKTTVISKSSYLLEKTFRKRVVVLRHRPSILPILSAWTKGKQEAEKIATGSLPRQGANNNPLSSLLRFAYYYADYFFGQFYIYLRYVRCGYIVLYDRYYFDFVNDSRRSNIRLSPALARWGYKWLIKPDLNIFLYAPAAEILKRKRELDGPTIEMLTDSYLQLFATLSGRYRQSRYISIDNRELEKTLHTIIEQVKITA